jgi:uncharacterized protein YqjF (DUF2071 family)
MSERPASSEPPLAEGLGETALAILVALHHRGPLSPDEARRLLALAAPPHGALAELAARGLADVQGETAAITHKGRMALDAVVEGTQGELAPDDPAYERRFRHEDPSLPFEANTVWAEAICANIRVAPEALRPLVPGVFELDLYAGRAWVSLTASRLKNFGMGVVPNALRMNFYQATYRAHVVFRDFRGRLMRGCYFVRSETNSRVMSTTANLLPEFKAHRCATYPILMARQGDHLLLSVDSRADPAGKVVLVLDAGNEIAEMPPGSVFPTRQAAYDFIVDFHDAFSYDPDENETFILRIERGEWHIRVLPVVDHYLGYIHDGPFPPGTAELDSVFYFQNTPYRWLPLIKERVKHERK